MGTYTQWASSKKVGRAVWVYGPEEVLKLQVSEYVRTRTGAKELDKLTFDAAADDEAAIWEAVYTRSLSDQDSRLVEISNASSLKSIGRLSEWLSLYARYSTETTILLTSQEDPPPGLKPPKATLVKCVLTKPEDRLQWTMDVGGLSEDSAKRLVEYKNGKLEGIRDICSKIGRLLPGLEGVELTIETLESLDEEVPCTALDAVLELNKKEALAAVAMIPGTGIGKLLSSLDHSLGLIDRLKEVLTVLPRGTKMEPIAGFPMARVAELAPIARTYSYKDIVRRRQLVVLAESYHRQGITDGLLEALVTLW